MCERNAALTHSTGGHSLNYLAQCCANMSTAAGNSAVLNINGTNGSALCNQFQMRLPSNLHSCVGQKFESDFEGNQQWTGSAEMSTTHPYECS